MKTFQFMALWAALLSIPLAIFHYPHRSIGCVAVSIVCVLFSVTKWGKD
jgi:hypothetical protein